MPEDASRPEEFLRARGVEPLAWDDVLRRVEAGLPAGEAAAFARLHRAFVAYPTEHTCRAFYDFAARHDLHPLLAGHRYERLAALLALLQHDVHARPGSEALDHGAGGGALAHWLRETRGLSVSAFDLSPATRTGLEAAGFPAPVPGARFDLIVCADSLCEIHADEDDWLSDPANADDERFADELEARYGLARKLSGFKDLLKPGGAVLVYEPIPLAHFWSGAARLLEREGWRAETTGAAPTWGLRLMME